MKHISYFLGEALSEIITNGEEAMRIEREDVAERKRQAEALMADAEIPTRPGEIA